MSYEHEQQEQLDYIRHWWTSSKKWAIPLLITLAILFIGYNGYIYYKQQQEAEVTELYNDFTTALQSESDVKKVTKYGSYLALKDKFQNHYFTQAALLQVATQAANVGNYDVAIAELTPLAQLNNKKGAFVCSAKIYLAGLFLEQKKYIKAIDVLRLPDDERAENEPICVAFTLERLGDIYFASNKPLEAKKQWELAQIFVKKHELQTKDENHPLKIVLDLKLQGF